MSPYVLIAVLLAYIFVTFGWRSWLHYRRTGSTGFRGTSGAVGSIEWWGGVLLVVGMVTSFIAPILVIRGMSTWELPKAVTIVGVVLLFAGFVGTVSAQLTMGASWRIGVDAAEHTTLITDGLFHYVRNPIFTSMLAVCLALVLLVPSVATLLGFAATWLGLELQVRLVEEPYLSREHPQYAEYTARTGRFLPKIW